MNSNHYPSKHITSKSNRQLLLMTVALLLMLTLVLVKPTSVLADGDRSNGEISVTTTDDEFSDDGPGNGCSLREAIQSANDDSDFGGCTRSGAAPYTITVPAAIYTLTITSTDENNNADGDLDLQASMAIEGAGAGQTIIQAGQDASSGIDRIFHITVDELAIEISNLTIRYGNAESGGGIYQSGDGSLTITDCAISENKASTQQGGGIFVLDGTVTINNSTVSNNTSYSSGGGLATPGTTNNPTLYVNNSTISGNTAGSNGGGGIRLQDGTLKIASTTIVSNTALGGTGRGGGGIRTTASSNPSIKNSIIANNSSDGEPGPDCEGTIDSGGYNLVEDTTDCGGLVGTDITGQDPLLSPLANNGGDTETHSLQIGSPAIDAANPSGCTDIDGDPLITDQRGRSRAYDGNTTCDIGAVEAQPDIMVLDGGVTIPDGTSQVDFGLTPMGMVIDKTFTISNTGVYTLTLTEPITVPAGFSVAGSFADTSVAPGGTTTFTIRFDSTSAGIFSGTLAFTNNDSDENPYTFTVIGQTAFGCYLPIIVNSQ